MTQVSIAANVRKKVFIAVFLGTLTSGLYAQTTTPAIDLSGVTSWLSNVYSAVNGMSQTITNGVSKIIEQLKALAQYDIQKESAKETAESSILFSASPDTGVASNYYSLVGEAIFANKNQIAANQDVDQDSLLNFANVMSDDKTGIFPTILNGDRSYQNALNIAKNLPLNTSDVKNNADGYNIRTLTGTDIYQNDDDKNKAVNFVNMVGSLGLNFRQGATEKILKGYLDKENKPGVLYMATMGSYAASQSIGLNAMYDMIARRTPQDNIKNLNLTDKEGRKIQTTAQLDRYLAERRALSPSWYNTLAGASPNSVLREVAFLLAEMRLQQFRAQQQQEQTLALLAAIHLAGVQSIGVSTVVSAQTNVKAAGGTLSGGNEGN